MHFASARKSACSFGVSSFGPNCCRLWVSQGVGERHLFSTIHNKRKKLILSGAFAGLVHAHVILVFDIFKVRVQHISDFHHLYRAEVRSIWHREGLSGFCCGYSPLVCREIINYAIFFAAFDLLK